MPLISFGVSLQAVSWPTEICHFVHIHIHNIIIIIIIIVIHIIIIILSQA